MTLPLRTAPAARTLVERQVVKRLRSELPYLAHCAPYAGQIPGTPEELAGAAGSFACPAVFVWTSDGRPTALDQRRKRWQLDTTLEIILVSRSLRGRAELHHGNDAASDPGVYQMLEDLRQTLLGVDLGIPGVGPLSLEKGPGERMMFVLPSIAVWQVRYQVNIFYSVTEDVGAERLSGVDTKINLPADEDQAANPIVEALTEVIQ